MKSQRFVLTLAFVVAVSSLSFAGIITPISASTDLSMSANAGCGTVSDSQYQDWTTNPPVLGNLSSSASAMATCSSPNRTLTTSGTLAATWTNNTKKGTIKFKNIGWTANKNVTNGAATADLGTDYTYTFMPTTLISFNLTFDISPNANNTSNDGLNGFFINLTDNWSGLYAVGTSGSLTATLLPGHTYTLSILNDAFRFGNLVSQKEHMDGTFNFIAAAVPEPSSMLLVGSGILALAGALRKKMIG